MQQFCRPMPHFDIAMTSEYPDILPPLNAFNRSAIAQSRGIARPPAPELRYWNPLLETERMNVLFLSIGSVATLEKNLFQSSFC